MIPEAIRANLKSCGNNREAVRTEKTAHGTQLNHETGETMSGWIRIHRKIQNHWIFQDAEKFRAWVDLLLLAEWRPEGRKILIEGRMVHIKRGDIALNLCGWGRGRKWGRNRVYRLMQTLKNEGMVITSNQGPFTLITICNYDSYNPIKNQETTDDGHIGGHIGGHIDGHIGGHIDGHTLYKEELKELKEIEELKEGGSDFQIFHELKTKWEELNPGYVWMSEDYMSLKNHTDFFSRKIKGQKKGKGSADFGASVYDIYNGIVNVWENLPKWFRDKADIRMISRNLNSITKEIENNGSDSQADDILLGIIEG